MPTSRKVKKSLFSILPSTIHGAVYELGSGWGNLAFPLATRFPNSSIRAFEISPIPWLFSRGVHTLYHYSNLSITRKDFFKANLKDAGLIVCYLYPGAMSRLKEKFKKELMPGTMIVTNTFAIPGWKPFKVIEVDDLYQSKIFLYLI